MTQGAIDFDAPTTVYAEHRAEVAQEAQRLASAKDRVLARLRQGSATNVELNAICYRYGARIMELRREGYAITKTHQSKGVWIYAL